MTHMLAVWGCQSSQKRLLIENWVRLLTWIQKTRVSLEGGVCHPLISHSPY